MRWSRLAALSMAVLLVGACGARSSPSSGAPPATSAPSVTAGPPTTTAPVTTTTTWLAHGQQQSRTAIPWDLVGNGWMLAVWGSRPADQVRAELYGEVVPATDATETLFLVNPDGGRYRVMSWPVTVDASNRTLSDWSGDGRRALFTTRQWNGSTSQTTLAEVDMTTGATHSFTLDGDVISAEYSRPKGTAILVTRRDETGWQSALDRFSTRGELQLSYPVDYPGVGHFGSGVVATPDGTQLVVGATTGVEVLDNDGHPLRSLPVLAGEPAQRPYARCAPVRWWSTGVMLTSCQEQGTGPDWWNYGPRLWLVPVDGTTPTPLTKPGTPEGPDLGDVSAWKVGPTVYAQALGGCGSVFLATVAPDGSTTPVTVPGIDNDQSTVVVGASGDRLALQATWACANGISLLWYTPASGATTTLLGPGVNDGNVVAAILRDDRQAA